MKIKKLILAKKEKISLGVCCLIISMGIAVNIGQTESIYTMAPTSDKVVVLDAGHGGWDPCIKIVI